MNFPPLKVPPSGFVVFGHSQPNQLNARLHYSDNMHFTYEMGYKLSAEILIKYVVDNLRHQDSLIYPIVFLLRQQLELQLKSILELLFKIDLRSSPPHLTHNLKFLWKDCRQPLIDLASPEDKEWFPAIDELMSQISEVDPNADAFRYSTLAKGGKSAPNLKCIHIGQLYESINPISNWLDGAHAYLDQIYDYQSSSNH